MYVTLDVESIDYRKLEKFLSANVPGLKGMGLRALLSTLAGMEPAKAEKALINGANLLEEPILGILNNAGADMGVRVKGIRLH